MGGRRTGGRAAAARAAAAAAAGASRPEGVELGPVPGGASPFAGGMAADRFSRGQLIHGLLQHLPSFRRGAAEAAARAFCDGRRMGCRRARRSEIAAEVLAILAHPDLAPLFGPDSRAEVPLTGVIGDAVVGGMVDRLAVLPDRVLIADFKTNRRPPARVEDTPVLYLRQMASYRAVLRAIFPGRPVRCALIWTREAKGGVLPDELLDSHDRPCKRTPA